MSVQIEDAQQGSAHVFFFTHRMTDDVIAFDRSPVSDQDRHRYDDQQGGGEPEIEQTSTRARNEIGVLVPKKSDSAAKQSKSGRDSQQVSEGHKAVQYEEGTDQSATERPGAV